MNNEPMVANIDSETMNSLVKHGSRIALIVSATASVIMGYMSIVNKIELISQRQDVMAKDILEIKNNHLVHVESKMNELAKSVGAHDLKIERILTILKQ